MSGRSQSRLSDRVHPLVLLLVLILSIFVLWGWWLHAASSSAKRRNPAPPNAVSTRLYADSAEPQALRATFTPSQFVPITGAVSFDGFDLVVDPGLALGSAEELGPELKAMLDYVSERLGYRAKSRFTMVFSRGPGCGVTGAAFTERRQVYVFTCPEIDRARSIAIMAHEVVHQLADDRYGAGGVGFDLALVEGLATYGAGAFWLNGYPDFRSYVRDQHAAGNTASLLANYRGVDVEGMNLAYYQWASLIEFLLTEFPDRDFDRLYITGNAEPGTANYQGIYGRSFADLEQEWLIWLNQ